MAMPCPRQVAMQLPLPAPGGPELAVKLASTQPMHQTIPKSYPNHPQTRHTSSATSAASATSTRVSIRQTLPLITAGVSASEKLWHSSRVPPTRRDSLARQLPALDAQLQLLNDMSYSC
ncbi:hypothetical protein M758_6G191700 [Ceratodon purpureus]|uniref:Uncharacterized protein n=1 Tax=Ceratodon purpureus TaxID=3225 RepID=A0A8T0HJI7_CERPU|nr:hypothetical protein KC19_6G200400 [Ceratodon purpureus]KAG0614628.1 hypothetical protein M758_6G191700 [Ceratodon purpureus]